MALLAGVTVAALLVRSGLSGNEATPLTTRPAATTTAATTETETRPTRTNTGPAGARRFYTIESGDTLESIALEHDTTVDALLELNPDVDPVALTVGQRIRVS